MKTKRFPRGLYAPELLEARIAPATFIVDSLLDTGADGTLRKEIADANARPGADTIVFKGAALEGKIALGAAGQLDITDSLTIKGPGAGRLIIDAGFASRIFNIDDGTTTVKTVSISGLSIINGQTAVGVSGGGIYCEESLNLSNVVVSDCDASKGGGMHVLTAGKVVITASIIISNTVSGRGGGLYLNYMAASRSSAAPFPATRPIAAAVCTPLSAPAARATSSSISVRSRKSSPSRSAAK